MARKKRDRLGKLVYGPGLFLENRPMAEAARRIIREHGSIMAGYRARLRELVRGRR